MKTIIHVNQHIIKSNKKHSQDEPVLTVKTYKSNIYCHEVEFKNGKVLYRPNKPLSCGAIVWIETNDPIKILR